MKTYKPLIIGILTFLLSTNTLHSSAQTASISHKISIQIEPTIVLYVESDDNIFGLFHIRGSRGKMDTSQMQVYKYGTKVAITSAIILQYIALEESEYINWNRTGYYSISHNVAVANQVDSGGPPKREIIVTVFQGEEGREYSIFEGSSSKPLR